MRKPIHHSAADGDHLPVRLIIVPEIVLLGFAIDHIDKKLAQFVIACACAQRFHDVELEITAETGPQLAVAGETQLVAALAEMEVRHRANKPDPLFASVNLIISRRTICPECWCWN